MDELCQSEFWNSNLTWYADSPDFTPCFKATVLVWIPCGFLWIFSILQVYNLKNSEYRDIPWSYFNTIKLILITITAILELLNIIHDISFVNFKPKIYLNSITLNIITTILFLNLTYHCKKKGIRSSGILLTFSFLRVLCDFPNFSTAIHSWNSFSNTTNTTNISILSDVFLTWMDSFFWKNYKNPTDKTLWHYHSKNDGYENMLNNNKKYAKSTKISTLRLLNKKYGQIFWYTTFLYIFYEVVNASLYIILHLFLSIIETNDQPMWKYYMYMVTIFTITVTQLFIISHYWKLCYKLEIHGKNAMLITLYEKALQISSRTRTEYTTSDIVSIMSVDLNQLQSTPRNIHSLLGMLMFVVVSYIYLGYVLGPCVWFSVIFFILILATSYCGSVSMKKLQRKEAQHKDTRNRFMQEMFLGIKVLKMYAWEYSFKTTAKNLRKKEERNLKLLEHVYTILQVFLSFSPYVLFLVTYLSLFVMNPKRSIGAIPIIVSMTLFYKFRNHLNILPNYCLSILQGLTSVKRIDKFLSAEEFDPNTISHDLTIEPVLLMRKASFSWISDKGPATLHNLDLQIENGELVAIVGSVGAGKSSLISACLGEMYKMSGYINTKGSVAYVPQQAWILNTTFKTNVTLDNKIPIDLYEKALGVCDLKHDIATFPGGDLTEIGEKGINLSGGQKQRVSLARAICQNADLYYFDDPLSALDSDVAAHVFQDAIGSNSILKEKTRILVTHSAKFFPFMDKIIVLKNGHIVEIGKYDELLSHNNEFVEFLRATSEKIRDMGANECEQFLEKETFCAVTPENRVDFKSRITYDSKNASSKLIDDETVQIDQVHKRLFYSYISTAGASLTIGTITLFTISQTLLLLTNVYISLWLSNDQPWNEKYIFLSMYTVLGIVQGIAFQFGNICLFKAAMKTSTFLYNKLLDSVLHWPMYLFDTTPIGRIISRFSDDVYVLDNVIGYVIGHAIILFYRNVALFILSIYFVPETILIVIPSIFVFYGIQALYAPMFHQIKRAEAIHRSPLYSHLVESVSGFQSIRAYNFEDKFIALTKEKNNLSMAAYYSSTLCTKWLFNRCETVGIICYTFMILITIHKKDNTHISYLSSLLILGVNILRSIGITVTQQSLLGDNILSLERIKEYIDQPQEASWNHSSVKVDEQWPHKGEIVFEDYNLRYRYDLEPVLKGISFRINSGEKVGIIGRTGAGKSSIFMGLFRIIEPSGGRILIDDVDITKLGLQLLRSKLTVIPQDPILFSGTLRFNIDPVGKHSVDSLWNVLEKSHLKQYVSGLAEGLNYVIEEGGKNLSFGQRQLICLARALLRKTKILVLDEATASVDVKTDELIQKTIRDEFSDCTVLTIAHRLNTLQNYDKILIIQDGKIVQFDTIENAMTTENLHSFNLK